MDAKVSRTERTEAMRERVRRAASDLFLERGFSATSVRDIAARAAVDPANISRYFGSKEGLFLDVVVPPADIGNLAEGPLESRAEAYVRFFLDARRGEHGSTFAALLRTSDRPEVGEALRDHSARLVTEPLALRLDGGDAILRAHLFTSALTGLQVSLWVAPDPVLLAADTDTVVRLFAPALQRLLTPSS